MRAPSPQISDLHSLKRAMSTRPRGRWVGETSQSHKIRHEYQSAAPSPFTGLQGQVRPETGFGTWKAHGFPASLRVSINRKAAGDSPCASHPNVAGFSGLCDRPCRTLRRRSPKGSPSGVRNRNRPKRTPELRHRRPDVHGRRDADARPQSGLGSWRILHRARNGVQILVETASRNDNRHLGRRAVRTLDYPDRPPADGVRTRRVSRAYFAPACRRRAVF